MKKMLVVLAAMAFVIVMVGGAYAAHDTTVGVSATVSANCSVSGGTIGFGALDAVTDVSGKTVDASPAPSIKCTKDATVTVTDDDGLNESGANALRMKDGSNYLAYTISYVSGLTGAGMNTDIGGKALGTDLNLQGIIAANALDEVPAGSYGDTITLTVSY